MFISRARILAVLFLSGFVLLGAVDVATAQSRAGVRAGISADPDQVYFGAHVDAAEIANQLWFRPNVEIGFGHSRTLTTLNAEFVYRPTTRAEWQPYFGGGPGMVLTTLRGPNRHTDVGPGFNFVAGLEQRKGLLAEIKIGAFDDPAFKLGIGWTW